MQYEGQYLCGVTARDIPEHNLEKNLIQLKFGDILQNNWPACFKCQGQEIQRKAMEVFQINRGRKEHQLIAYMILNQVKKRAIENIIGINDEM